MGQYYNPSILKKNWKQAKNPVEVSLKCYDFGNGAKLMEHSYVGNRFVEANMYLLGEDYFGHPFVWCGDYADSVTTNTGEHNIWNDAENFMYEDKNGEYVDTRAYKKLVESLPKAEDMPQYKYIVNLTKKQIAEIPESKEDEWTVHPLPLLTCAGNSLGGGDYRLANDEYDYSKDKRIGSWAFDKIGAANDVTEYLKRGYKVIDNYFPIDW